MARYVLLVILLYALGIGLLLIPSCRSGSVPQQESYLNMMTAGLTERSRSADEMEPYSYSVDLPEIETADAGWSIEAESADYPREARVSRVRRGYSGIGYVAGLPENTESAVVFPVTVPYSQHYAVTLCLATDDGASGAVRVNGAVISPFTLEGSSLFTRVTFYGVFLEKGDAEISLDTADGSLECDYIELTNDSSLDRVDFRIDEETCDKNASDSAKHLYGFLREHWGKQILTGQFVSDSSNRELGIIYTMTGQLPAIRFSELGTEDDLSQIQSAIDWNVYMHGVVGLMWQWNAPGSSSVYAADTDFSLERALYRVDADALSAMSQDAIQDEIDKQQLPADCLKLVQDIDKIAGYLKMLADMDIPVLWRPLHEAGGGWYWWGASEPKYYTRLWSLLFRRLTGYHGLHNLIWVWNAQSASYPVPEDTYDIASVDVYLHADHAYGSRYEQFLSLARITEGKKMLALSECSALPDLKMLSVDQTVWSYFGLWYGVYIMKPDGSFSDAYYSSNDLYNLYNSDLAFSLNDFLSFYQ